MNFLLSVAKSDYADKIIETKGFGETLGFGATMLLIGMATVFAVLCILWICLMGFKVGFHDLPEKRKKAAEALEAAPQKAVVEEVAPVSDDGEIIAAIAAAIAMAESESSGIKFKVVSFKRK